MATTIKQMNDSAHEKLLDALQLFAPVEKIFHENENTVTCGGKFTYKEHDFIIEFMAEHILFKGEFKIIYFNREQNRLRRHDFYQYTDCPVTAKKFIKTMKSFEEAMISTIQDLVAEIIDYVESWPEKEKSEKEQREKNKKKRENKLARIATTTLKVTRNETDFQETVRVPLHLLSEDMLTLMEKEFKKK